MLSASTATAPRRRLSEAKIPNYETPDEAAAAFLALVEYGRNQAALLQTPAASIERSPDARAAARAVFDAVLAENRETLTEPEAKRVLAAYGIPTVETVVVASAKEAAEAAAKLTLPVALTSLVFKRFHIGGQIVDSVGLDDQVRHFIMRCVEPDVERAGRHARRVGDGVEAARAQNGRPVIVGFDGVAAGASALRVCVSANRISKAGWGTWRDLRRTRAGQADRRGSC